MASYSAHAHHTDSAGEPSARDSSRALRIRQASGSAPRAMPSGAGFDCSDEGFEEDAVGETGEPTRVTPDELLETLREASRTDAHPPEGGEIPAPEIGDEEDALMFAMQQAAELRRSWIRRAAPLTGAAALTSLLALQVDDHQELLPWSVEDKTDVSSAAANAEPAKLVTRVASAKEAINAEPNVENEVVDGPSAESEHAASPDMQRRWMLELERGESRLADEEYDDAAFSFERAIEYYPNDSRGYAGLGSAELGRGQWGAAVRALRKAVELSPYDAGLRAELGRAYEQSGNPRLAKRAFSRARKLDPTISE